MLSPTPSELPRLKSASAPTKPVSALRPRQARPPRDGTKFPLNSRIRRYSGQQAPRSRKKQRSFGDPLPLQSKNRPSLRHSDPTFAQNQRSQERTSPTFVGKRCFRRGIAPHFCGRTRAFSSQSAPPRWRGWEPESDRSRREVILSNRKQLSRTGRTPPSADK